jgi:hypothetical protein
MAGLLGAVCAWWLAWWLGAVCAWCGFFWGVGERVLLFIVLVCGKMPLFKEKDVL